MSAEAKLFLLLAASNGALAVILGAFGAHGLKNSVSEPLLAAWQTGVQYHFYHVLALGLVALLSMQGIAGNGLAIAGWCGYCVV